MRLDNFDYSTVGGYYVTICTANRKPIFGEFLGGEVVLNNYGEFARDEWMRTGDGRQLDERVNHRLTPTLVSYRQSKRFLDTLEMTEALQDPQQNN